MRGSFTRRGRKCEVTLTKTHFKGTVKNSLGPNLQWCVSVDDVLAVQARCEVGESGESSCVTVHHVTHGSQQQLSWSKLVLSGEPELCKELNNSLNTVLSERLKSKTFLVVINPAGGSKSASRVFHKKVAPLLRTCNISFKVYETRGPDDAPNAFNDVDFSELDGVLCVGGDGHYSKLLRALVEANCSRLGQAPVTADSRLPPLPFPVGIIPGGTGNYVANYLGCKDPVTAAIRVVLGHTVPTNLTSIYQGDKLEGYAGLICAFGLIGDMIHSCEQARWMGPLRYTVMPIKRMFSRRLMEVEVSMRLESSSTEWTPHTGHLYSVDTGVVDLTDSGTNLLPVFGDSAMTLHLTSACSLGDHLKHLSKVQAWATQAYEFSFVESHRVLEYRVTLGGNSSTTDQGQTNAQTTTEPFYMNLDGEALPIYHSFTARLHTGVLSLFGTQKQN